MLRDKVVMVVDEFSSRLNVCGDATSKLIINAEELLKNVNQTLDEDINVKIQNTIELDNHIKFLLSSVQNMQMILEQIKMYAQGIETL